MHKSHKVGCNAKIILSIVRPCNGINTYSRSNLSHFISVNGSARPKFRSIDTLHLLRIIFMAFSGCSRQNVIIRTVLGTLKDDGYYNLQQKQHTNNSSSSSSRYVNEPFSSICFSPCARNTKQERTPNSIDDLCQGNRGGLMVANNSRVNHKCSRETTTPTSEALSRVLCAHWSNNSDSYQWNKHNNVLYCLNAIFAQRKQQINLWLGVIQNPAANELACWKLYRQL